MATYIKTILPSGKGLWLEKLTTKQYRAVNERVANRLGDGVTQLQFTNKMAHEILLASLRGVTAEPIPQEFAEDGEMDIDKMLDTLPETAWIMPTYEDLITEGPRNLDNLLDDAADYAVAEGVAGTETLGGVGAFRGKRKREFGAR